MQRFNNCFRISMYTYVIRERKQNKKLGTKIRVNED